MDIPPEILALPPLALAAGVDLYLTLLFLGAASATPWWDDPMPGALGDLSSPGIIIVLGVLYLMELLAERYRPSALVWNAFHAVIRPVAVALFALMLLEGQPIGILVSGAVLAAVISSLAHAVRSGAAILRWLSPGPTPHVLLVSLLEDALVLGLVALSLDAPGWAAGACAVAMLTAGPGMPSRIRAFSFAIRAALSRSFRTLIHRRWLAADELPAWVHARLADDTTELGGALRGSQAGAHRLAGAPRFATGWVVVRGSTPLFVFRKPSGSGAVDLGDLTATSVSDTGYFRRVDLERADGGMACIFFGGNGPPEASLEAEFLFR